MRSGEEGVVLVSGFEPFDPPWPNPSGDVARALDGSTIAGARVVGIVLPVAYGEAGRLLAAEVARVRPRAVLSLGMGDARFRVERVAVDGADDGRPDNRGVVRLGGHRSYAAEALLRETSLAIDPILQAWRRIGVEPHVSESAGRFVCNDLFYDLLRTAEAHGISRAGFIHVPHPKHFRPGGLDQPVVERAVTAALEAIVTCPPRA